jgi:hypothetical protein
MSERQSDETACKKMEFGWLVAGGNGDEEHLAQHTGNVSVPLVSGTRPDNPAHTHIHSLISSAGMATPSNYAPR